MEWMKNFNSRFQKNMNGRYGIDSYTVFLETAGALLIVIGSWLPGNFKLISLLGFIPMAYGTFRIYSRNIFMRKREFYKYKNFKESVAGNVKFWNKKATDKQYQYFKCPHCKKKLRVPRGKGNITVTCPRCRSEFKGKS